MSPTSCSIFPKLGLAPDDEAQRWFANGLQLTITDLVAEVHDSHHPIALSKYFEDQKSEAKARTAEFIRYRMPKFLGYFECVLKQNGDGSTSIVGTKRSYVDLSLFQLMPAFDTPSLRPCVIMLSAILP